MKIIENTTFRIVVSRTLLAILFLILLTLIGIYGLLSVGLVKEYPFISVNGGRYFPITLLINAIIFSFPLGVFMIPLVRSRGKWKLFALAALLCWVSGWCVVAAYFNDRYDSLNRIDLNFYTSRVLLNEKIEKIEVEPMSYAEIRQYLSDSLANSDGAIERCKIVSSLGLIEFKNLPIRYTKIDRRRYVFDYPINFEDFKNIKIVCDEIEWEMLIAERDKKQKEGSIDVKAGPFHLFTGKPSISPILVNTKMHSSGSDILAMSYLSNDRYLVTGGNDGSIRLWDVNSSRLLRKIQTTQSIQRIRVTPDDKYIIAGFNSAIGIWKVSDGTFVRQISSSMALSGMFALSKDGKFIAYANSPGTIFVVDLVYGSTFSLPNEYVEHIVAINFSPSGRHLIAANAKQKISIFDLAKKEVIWSEKSRASSIQNVDFIDDFGKVVFIEHLDEGKRFRIREENYLSPSPAKMVSFPFQDRHELVRNSVLNHDRTKLIISGFGWFKIVDLSNYNSLYDESSSSYQSKLGSAIAASPSNKFVAYSDEIDSSNAISELNIAKKSKKTIVKGSEDGEIITAKFSSNGSVFGTVSRGGGESRVVAWDLKSNIPKLNRFYFKNPGAYLSFDDDITKMYVSDSEFSKKLNKMKPGDSIQIPVGGGADKHHVAVRRFDTIDNLFEFDILGKSWEYAFAINPMETQAITSGDSRTITLWDLKKNHPIKKFDVQHGVPKLLRFSRDGAYFASTESDSTSIRVWDLNRSIIVGELNYGKKEVDKFGIRSVDFCTSDSLLAASDRNGSVRIWNFLTGKEVSSLRAATKSVALHPSCEFLATVTSDGSVDLWKTSSGALLATLTSYSDGTWVIADTEGRFDTSDLEGMPHLHWMLPNDPLATVPLEAFMKDYYEPRLLARIMAGETFKPVRPVTSLNRTQPEVQITSVTPVRSDSSLVNVTVSTNGATKSYLQGDKEVQRPTAVHDLRLFRDGQVVGYADGKLADSKGTAFSKTFTVRLPKGKAGKEFVFSAYAFNDDRVKSETVRTTYKAPEPPTTSDASKGKAYVIRGC